MRGRPYARPQPTNGSTMRTPAFTKSARFRVATARPWKTAVAAIRLSFIGMAFPVVRRRASSSAHIRPGSASQERQWRRPTPASNQRSRAARFLPLGRMRIPNRSSPRMTGSTAISGSCARSHVTTRGSGAGFVGSLRTLACLSQLGSSAAGKPFRISGGVQKVSTTKWVCVLGESSWSHQAVRSFAMRS